MRTKTMLLSALLGTVGSISLMAQSTNVYSLNAVGYINVTIQPGFNVFTAPLILTPDNTLNSVLPNSTGQYKGWKVYFFVNGQGYSQTELGTKSGWQDGGTNTINPGQAVFIDSSFSTNYTVTLVGTVPQGSLTNVLVTGLNLVGSPVPTAGDLVTNGITAINSAAVKGDKIIVYDQTDGYNAPNGGTFLAVKNGGWSPSDPTMQYVGEGFFYLNQSGANENWIENFSISQ